jgi:Rieske Fe-S protein
MSSPTRRSALVRFVLAGTGVIGAACAGLVALVAAPRRSGRARQWRKAASIFDLPADGPFPAVIVERQADGWYETRRQTVVFLDREGDGYRALSSTCSHLSCRVRWDGDSKRFLCPCHGGVYDREGRVVSGPPPKALDRFAVRVNPQTSDIEVEL